MKVYRIIGTVLSALLALVFAIELFGLVLMHSASMAVNKETISDIADAFLENEELYGEMTEEISKSVSASISTKITANIADNTPFLNAEAVEKAVNEVLNSDEFKDVISDVASDLVMDMIDPNTESVTVNVTEKVAEMFVEHPDTFNTIVEEIAVESNFSYDDVYNTAAAYAEEAGIDMLEYGASYAEMLSAVVSSGSEELNGILNEYLAAAGLVTLPEEIPDELPDVDYTSMDPDAEGEAAISAMQAIMKEVGIILEFLKSPLFIAIICGSFLLFFGICALLTWSIKRPLLISGIMTMFYGILLLTTAAIPYPEAIVTSLLEDSFGTAVSTASNIILVAWNAACHNIMLRGIAVTVFGALLIGGFILWQVLLAKRRAHIAPIPTLVEE